VGERFLLRVRTSFFRHLQSLSHVFLDRRRLGDVLARLTGDVTAIESFVLSGVGEVLSSVLRILFFAGALFWLDWQLALVSLFVAPLFLVAVRVFAQPLQDASREKRRRSGSLSSVAEESLSNAALVQAYNRQDSEVARFHRENRNTAEAELAATRVGALFTPLVNLVELAGGMLVILFGVYALSAGRLTLGGLLVFLTYLSQLYGPIRDLGELGTSIYSASASAERIIEFLDQRPLVTERPDARRLDTVRGAVEFDDVSFRYPDAGHDALRGVSLRVEPGQVLALVGASGAGKSTVARLLLRFFDPTHGAVRLDGHDLRSLRLDSLRDQVGVLLQETLVFDGSVRDNIAFGRPDASPDEIEAAARAADAHDFVSALPDGYDAIVGQKGRLLSGGQRQRIAIARALLRDTPVLILDEPSTGLDGESTERIMEPLRRLMADRTVIVISHNLSTVRDADLVAVLEEGRVVELGAPDALLTEQGRWARMTGVPPTRPSPNGRDHSGVAGHAGPVP
jgi:ATP-binding cassette, subfamily B, bacterial